MRPDQIRIQDYTYDLPEDKVARYPLPERDASKLLLYSDGEIADQSFANLPQLLPQNSLLIFNKTKVVNARLLFKKPSGGVIEIFCLEPHERYADITTAMMQQEQVLWHCMVGGAGKWKHGIILELYVPEQDFTMFAKIVERTSKDFIIELSWDKESLSFAEVLKHAGKIPLPPYLHREAELSDQTRYQTMFAEQEGSVAAPTASLHFTENIMQQLTARGVESSMLTLHVGAGTFKPVKADMIGDHEMHEEWIEVDSATIKQLLTRKDKPVIAVGTTALRTLESLYWMGAKAFLDPTLTVKQLSVGQWEPYDSIASVSVEEALNALLKVLERDGHSRLVSKTQILIAPRYQFHMVNGLITNFHQPQSTLLLLVAALIGDDWKQVYNHALSNDYRFLSYGDSSLLWAKS